MLVVPACKIEIRSWKCCLTRLKWTCIIDGGNFPFYRHGSKRGLLFKEKDFIFWIREFPVGLKVLGGARVLCWRNKESLFSMWSRSLKQFLQKSRVNPVWTTLAKSAGKLCQGGSTMGFELFTWCNWLRSFDLMKKSVGLSNAERHEVVFHLEFRKASIFFGEITARDFCPNRIHFTEWRFGGFDFWISKQKRTENGTSQNAMDLRNPCSHGSKWAVSMREISFERERLLCDWVVFRDPKLWEFSKEDMIAFKRRQACISPLLYPMRQDYINWKLAFHWIMGRVGYGVIGQKSGELDVSSEQDCGGYRWCIYRQNPPLLEFLATCCWSPCFFVGKVRRHFGC